MQTSKNPLAYTIAPSGRRIIYFMCKSALLFMSTHTATLATPGRRTLHNAKDLVLLCILPKILALPFLLPPTDPKGKPMLGYRNQL